MFKHTIRTRVLYCLGLCSWLLASPVSALTATQAAKLLAGDGASDDWFGVSVDIDGDTAVIGASNGNVSKAGSAYVFTRSTGGGWILQQKLTATDGTVDDAFGARVAIDGDTIVIGAQGRDSNGVVDSGSAYVFTRSAGNWTQQAILDAADGAEGDSFGVSVAIGGDTAVIGSWGDDDKGDFSGSAYVFNRTAGVWTQQAKLNAADGVTNQAFGFSVAVNGDTAVVGDHWFFNPGDTGSAYVFARSGSSWSQQTKLNAADGAGGDNFSYRVAVNGNTALIGAPGDDDNGNNSGSAYVFTHSGANWNQQTKLLSSDGDAGDNFGATLDIDADAAVIGGYRGGQPILTHPEAAYVFTRSGMAWSEQAKLIATEGTLGDDFSVSVAVDGATAVVGANFDNDMGAQSGSAYVFNLNTSPLVIPNIIGTLGANGWYISPVTISWFIKDTVDPFPKFTGCVASTINNDTTGQTFTCSASDQAGNTDSKSVTIKVDLTDPV